MNSEIELADIPSDPESVDGICISEDENEEYLCARPERTENHVSLDRSTIDMEESEGSDSERDEIWSKVSKPNEDIPFDKTFGPNIPENTNSPKDIWFCLFPPDLLDLIVEQTNLYANQMKSKQRPVTKNELITFIEINILIGVKKLPYYWDFWSTNSQLHDSYISSLMTVNRFGFLLNHIHINDNQKEPKKGDVRYNKLYKVRPLLDKLSVSFKNCWKPGKY